MLLKFFFDPPLFGLARKTGPKCSNSSQAVLLLGLPVILLRISASSAALDALATHGMRVGCMDYPAAEVFTDRHFEHSAYYCNKIYSFMLLTTGNLVWYCQSTKAKVTLWSVDLIEGLNCWNML